MEVIACLGWGSLYWDPEPLPVSDWHEDGPELPIEFCRQSKGSRVTLVIVPHRPRVTTLWTKLKVPSLSRAIEALREREDTVTSQIGWIDGYHSSNHPFAAEIAAWAKSKSISAAVWTALPPKWDRQQDRVPTEQEVVTFLKERRGEEAQSARKYVEHAPAQIATLYRAAIERELGWRPRKKVGGVPHFSP